MTSVAERRAALEQALAEALAVGDRELVSRTRAMLEAETHRAVVLETERQEAPRV